MQEAAVVGIGQVVVLMAERVVMHSTNSERACLVGSGSRTRTGHAGVDTAGKALVQYLAELDTAGPSSEDTASTAWALTAACSGIDTIAGHAVGGSAAAWGVGEDAAVGMHGRRGVGSGEKRAYTAAHVVVDHCGAELPAGHEGWPVCGCSSRRLVLAVMALVRPAVWTNKPTRPAQRLASTLARFRRPDLSTLARMEKYSISSAVDGVVWSS